GYHRLDYVDELVELLTNDAYPYVRIAAAQALGATATPRHDVAIAQLQRLVMDPNTLLAAAAEDARGEIANRHIRPDSAIAPRHYALAWLLATCYGGAYLLLINCRNALAYRALGRGIFCVLKH